MITKYTSDIFETLRKGQFISSNSPDEQIQILYRQLENEEIFEKTKEYFEEINYVLERGDGYFYFSRVESRVDLERKLKAGFNWIDILDFFKTYDSSFGSGFRFSPSEIVASLNTNANLKSKLNSFKGKISNKKNYVEMVKNIVNTLVSDGFLALEDELTDTYKVLSSFKYLEVFVETINIPEELIDEIPE